MKLSNSAQSIVNLAYQNAKENRHFYVYPEHLLYVSLFFDEVQDLFDRHDINVLLILDRLDSFFNKDLLGEANAQEPFQTRRFQKILEIALFSKQASEGVLVEAEDLIWALLEEVGPSAAAMALKQSGLSRTKSLDEKEIPKKESLYQENKSVDSVALVKKFSSKVYLSNLNKLAEDKKLDPLIGREEVLQRTIQVLCRRFKNNPVHVGEAGVGKTSITEGLAQRIVQGRVPKMLKDCTVYSLDVGALVAGTRYRGDLEERLNRVFKELLQKKNAILFIDEIHNIISSGPLGGGTVDVSDLLKPILIQGAIRFIGATTFAEYKRSFEKDKAFERRFQKIQVDEPSVREAITILEGLKPFYERYHKVLYPKAVLSLMAHLTHGHVLEKFLPDKAIDLMDEAGAALHIRNESSVVEKQKSVTPQLVQEILSKMMHLPLDVLHEDPFKLMRNLERRLKASIFGQNHVIKYMVRHLKGSFLGLNKGNKPQASFLFLGTTGVGKTELSIQLAKHLQMPFHRFDMSEYQESHAVARFVGAPPGYIGSDEGGMLVDLVRKSPRGVILFDEIEKAHSDVYNLFLQILDHATLTDSLGRKADFSESIIVFTSNTGAELFGSTPVGFGDAVQTYDESVFHQSAEKHFRPEFLNRLDGMIVFSPLELESVKHIVLKELAQLQSRLKRHLMTLRYNESVVDFLAQKGTSKQYGARFLHRSIDNLVKTPLLNKLLLGQRKGLIADLHIHGDKLKIRFIPHTVGTKPSREVPGERSEKKELKKVII